MMQLDSMNTGTIEKKVSVGYRLDPRAVAILEEASARAGIDKTEVVELCLFRAAEVVAEHMERRAESARRFATDGSVSRDRFRAVSSGPPAGVATAAQRVVTGALAKLQPTPATGESTAPASPPAIGGRKKKGGPR